MYRPLLYLILVASLHADVTIRYQTTVKPALMPDMAGMMNSPEAIRIKGNMGHITNAGATMIVDFDSERVTILDAWHAKFTTLPAAEYSSRIASALPDDVKGGTIFPSSNGKVEIKVTGREEVIRGVRAVEREVRISFAEPPGMVMVMQIWTSKPSEAFRVPAVRELSALHRLERYVLNPVGGFAGAVPGGGDFGMLMAETQKDESLILRTQARVSLPGNGRVIELLQEAIEVSTAPIDPAIFRIPEDYTAAPFEEVLLGAVKGRMAATTIAGTGGPDLPAPGTVQAYVPRLNPVYRVEPELASPLSASGRVRLLVTVDPRGNVAQVEALTGLGALRLAAVAAVKQWRFQPVVRNGQSVFAYTDVTVSFIVPNGPMDTSSAVRTAELAAIQRLWELEQSMPRSAAQVLADLEQDSEGGDAMRRFYALGEIAQAALAASADEKAAAFSQELLDEAARNEKNWNFGMPSIPAIWFLGCSRSSAATWAPPVGNCWPPGRLPALRN